MEDVVRDTPRDTEPDAEQAEAAYRGFLFADLRGYTAFVERHGDAAAADLLDAYRTLVRDEVARHAGAEIRTEGDSFYVVFPSARRAVSCGLAIVAAAARFRAEHPERPIRVGIGINAGETVQRGEGYVGSAVNLAARVCAQAREGEVLITAAVRDAVGSGGGLRFVARGSRRLKGIARPVTLFAVQPGAAPAHRTRPTSLAAIPWLRVGVVAIAAVLTLAVAAVSGWPGNRQPSGAAPSPTNATSSPPSGSPTASPSPTADAAVFPNEAEAELLAKTSSAAEDCERADEDVTPALIIDRENAEALGLPPRLPINRTAGITCEIPSLSAPDTVHYWSAQYTADISAVDVPEGLLHNQAGQRDIPQGDCPAQPEAYGEWELGDLGGWLLCREDFGDAVIIWTYDGSPILGMAIRRDGDLAALLDWWTAEARFLRP